MVPRSVVHIVWSPRRIERSLRAHEALGIPTAFICGYNEHEGCAKANEIVAATPEVDVYLLSYDDQCPTREQMERVLGLQAETGDVVSGWQCLGEDSPYGSATRPEWGRRPLMSVPECFYTRSELAALAERGELVRSNYLAALTAVPRDWMLESPMWAMPSGTVQGDALKVWPSRDGKPYDKGCASDWTLAMDLIHAGHRIWIAPDVEVKHLAPRHGVPAHKFWMAEEPQGVFWNRRPRNEAEFEQVFASAPSSFLVPSA